MKAMLLRVGIDKSSDGVLSPIFSDGSFEYIPLSEKDENSIEKRTYKEIVGRKGYQLSYYLPEKVAIREVHLDPEFNAFTYGDEGRKAVYLRNLMPGDLLVFYAGLRPYENDRYSEALYIIGYFVIMDIIDFKDKHKPDNKYSIKNIRQKYPSNSHPKRSDVRDMVLVVGDPEESKILDKAIIISQKKVNKIGRTYHAVSPQIEELLGIKGSIQRSIPPRFVVDEDKVKNLLFLLGIKFDSRKK